MNWTAVLTGLDALGLDVASVAPSVDRAQRKLTKIFETDVEPKATPTRAQLARRLMAEVDDDDPEQRANRIIVMAREALELAAATQLGHGALQDALELQERAVEQAVKGFAPRLIVATLRPLFDKLLAETRELPTSTPTNAEQAINAGDGDVVLHYRRLVELSARFTRIAAVHRELIVEDLQTAQMLVFADCRCGATVGQATVERAGPGSPLLRLFWLASAVDAEPWLPTALELADHYGQWMRDRSQQGAGQKLHPATVS
jgi:hypothetical protein